MDVVMITNNTFEDKKGGHERYVRELSRALVRQGASVTIVAKRHPGTPAREACSDGVKLERYPVPSKRTPLFAPIYPILTGVGVWQRVRCAGQRTVLHAHMSVPALALSMGSYRHRYLFTLHAPLWRELLAERQDSYSLPRITQQFVVNTLQRVERRVVRHSAAAVVLSNFMRFELALLDAPTGANAHVIPGGIDDRRFSPGDARRDLFNGGGPLLFTARRFTPRTGVDELIRALPRIRARYPSACLAIAGTGPMENELRRLVVTLELSDAVRFLGSLGDDDLVAWYRTATLTVVPSLDFEGFGLSTAEALACGTPVVGTPSGATTELLRPLDPALVAADRSAEAMARSITNLLDDKNRLARARKGARARVSGMGWDDIAQRHLSLYETIARLGSTET